MTQLVEIEAGVLVGMIMHLLKLFKSQIKPTNSTLPRVMSIRASKK